MQKITPFLWYDDKAEEAARFYVSLFKDSRVTGVQRFGENAPGTQVKVMLVNFILDGVEFTAMNAGPMFKFNEAFSMSVDCADQAEVDRLWAALSAGGEVQQCGWLKDRYGLSWQIVPSRLGELMSDPDPARVARVNAAMLKMIKLDVRALEAAAQGE